MFLDRIKNRIDHATVISFDVFDTLLLRPYAEPTDVFRHIENKNGLFGFANERIDAEMRTRHNNPAREDITLDEIYNEISDEFKNLKQSEIEWELKILTTNPEMKAVWDYAKSRGKKIVVTSDMYLPSSVIEQALAKNGFDGYDRLYVSGDIGKTKHFGTLYAHIIKDTVDNASDILHIGDNKNSDYKQAKKAGLRAALYEQVLTQFLKNNTRAKKIMELPFVPSDIGPGIMMSVIAQRWQKQKMGIITSDYWTDLGYQYAGPLAYVFTKWVQAKSNKKNINHLLFIARDGYTLQRVFDLFNSDIKSSYVYAPRFIWTIASLDYSHPDKKNVENLSKLIVEHYAQTNENIAKRVKNINFAKTSHADFIRDNIDALRPLAEKYSQNYKKYITKIVRENDNVGVVDTVGMKFSGQKLLSMGLGRTLHGLYFACMGGQGMFINPNTVSFYTDNLTNNWNFVEFLITSPEPPVENVINGNPIFKENISKFEKEQRNNYKFISDGAVEFAHDIISIFGYAPDLFMSDFALTSHLNAFINMPTMRDSIKFNSIKISQYADNKHYTSLLAKDWGNNLIRFRMGGIKRIHINLFPRLPVKLLEFRLGITEKCWYKFAFGNWRGDE